MSQFTKTEIKAIAEAVGQILTAKQNMEKSEGDCKDEEVGCPIGITERHVKALDRLTDILEAGDKTVRKAITKIILYGIIGLFLMLIGDKAKVFIKGLVSLFQ